MKQVKIVIEKHSDGYVAYPVGVKGVVGEGDTYEEALRDVQSALKFHLETFGPDVSLSRSRLWARRNPPARVDRETSDSRGRRHGLRDVFG